MDLTMAGMPATPQNRAAAFWGAQQLAGSGTSLNSNVTLLSLATEATLSHQEQEKISEA
jgi:hypothetical protein